jgi:hypothetical protein
MGFNGLWMMADPGGWYQAMPGVPETGPLNAHFVRDIGAAFLTFGAGLALAIRPLPARFALVSIAALFAVLHALIHLAEVIGPEGRLLEAPRRLRSWLPHLPPWSRRSGPGRAPTTAHNDRRPRHPHDRAAHRHERGLSA